jgi:thioredoxin:protein disulfide reductase
LQKPDGLEPADAQHIVTFMSNLAARELPVLDIRQLMLRSLVAITTLLCLTLLGAPALASSSDDAFTHALSNGPMAAALAAFLGGLLVSLTPCVYPMVAVTVSVFGAKKARSRWQGIALSSAFVFGIMVMFVALGLVAAFTGSVFGGALQNTWVVLAISALFAVMALSMFGFFELSLPSSLLNRLAQVGGIGIRGAFLLGLVSGVVASPCTGPVLTGILAWIATTRDFLLGTLAMSAFALGLGVPFFAVGAFAIQLPKSGRWMVAVKAGLGTILLVVALYFAGSKLPFLSRMIPHGKAGWYGVGIGSLLAIALTWLASRRAVAVAPRALHAVAILLFALSGFGAVTKLTRAESTLTWQHQNYSAMRERALHEQLPMLVDFTANWCTACKELDRVTFAHPDVRAEAGRFIAVKVDASVDDDPDVVATMTKLAVKGLPTVVLFDRHGNEVRRFTDFVNAADLLLALRAVP